MWLLASMSLPACAGKVPAHPMAARDGDVLAPVAPVRIGLIGGLAQAPTTLADDLRAQSLSFVVLHGDAVPNGRASAYEVLQDTLTDLSVVPLPGPGESRGDPALHRWASAWEGLGVRGLDDPVSWRAFDLVSEQTTWRILVLDADRERLGDRWADQLFWLPKALGGEAPLIVLMNQPVGSLAAGWQAERSRGARELHEILRRHTDPRRIGLVAAGGTIPPELVLPGGPWGEGWIGVGQVGGPPQTLTRATEQLAIEPNLDASLLEYFALAGANMSSVNAGGDYAPPRYPLAGWWRVELEGQTLHTTLRLSTAEGWRDVHTSSWSMHTGWTSP